MHKSKNKRKLRVFVGPGNTAGNAHYIARSLRMVGAKARSYAYEKHVFGYPTDRVVLQFRSLKKKGPVKLVNNRFVLHPLNALIRVVFFVSVLFRYDLFYFISPITFFENHADLGILRFFGKKVAFFFPGCAEKNPYDELNMMKYSFCWYCTDTKKQTFCLCNQPDKKKARIRKFEKHADYIFSRPSTSGYLKYPEKAWPMWLMTDPPKQPVSMDKFRNPSAVRIMHFPSHRELKGTKYVEEAITHLKDKYEIEYTCRRMTNQEVLKNLESAHVLIDQFTHTFGLLSVEGLSRGCVVVCRLEEWARKSYPDLPVVSCNPEDLEETLAELLKDRQRMAEIAQKSMDWYRKNATLEVVGNRMLNIFSDNHS
ncbi:glycosyltransferase [Thermophagus sp. OGC60D27]|uniref:glycosyltransferase n=1 Tax=Thermophagus sp. OGC60D27 TaxID=3458415 RepID=UPI0040382475